MRHSLSFFFFFLVILIVSVVDADIVEETCQKAAQGDKILHYDFCVAALREDPKSHSADLPGLFIISMELTIDNATKIGSRIGKLLNDKKLVRDVRMRLEDCQLNYSVAVDDAKVAVDAFKSKDYHTASSNVGAAMTMATSCEDGFKEKPGLKSPLTKENNDVFQLTDIALDIIALVD